MLLIELQILPPIPVFIKAWTEGGILIEAKEHYQKRSFRNRFDITDTQGLHTVSIPLRKGKNQNKLITETEIAYDEAWFDQVNKIITTAYGRAPFFQEFSEDFFSLLSSKEKYLFDFSKQILIWTLETIQLPLTILETLEYHKNSEINNLDWRNKKMTFYRKYSSNKQPAYDQIFEDRLEFIPNLSILDLIFNRGPEAGWMIQQTNNY